MELHYKRKQKTHNDNVTIHTGELFQYLDMDLYLKQDELNFLIQFKPTQQLKYMNKGSTHTNATCRTIPHGVLKNLTNRSSTSTKSEHWKQATQ